jgi:hypothetical protein
MDLRKGSEKAPSQLYSSNIQAIFIELIAEVQPVMNTMKFPSYTQKKVKIEFSILEGIP